MDPEMAMAQRENGTHRLTLFSDAVFAVIITILVLDLKPPAEHSFAALLPLWPVGVSYAISYWFIAIVWVNHHHLMKFAHASTARLTWANFAHLFTVSLVPFSTSWIADSRLAPAPVSLYAAIFVLVNATYLALCWEVMDRPKLGDTAMRQMMRMRSWLTLGLFTTAAVLALFTPLGGMILICLCLILYIRPELRAARRKI
jgi:uncharacterized membrane protein